MSCGRAQEFLAKERIETLIEINAKKTAFKEEETLALVRDIDEIYAAKGKKVVHVDIKKNKPDKATLTGVLLGPTGNLRAPAIRRGRVLIVGFDEEIYKRLLR